MMRAAVLVAVSVFSIESHSADLKPYRCTTESSVGARTTEGDIRAVAFSGREEYRIKPSGDWYRDLAAESLFGELLLGEVEQAAAKADVGVSLIRRVSDDPKEITSWSACRVNGMPEDLGGPYNLIFCAPSPWNGLPEIRFNADTGRFTTAQMGDWHGTKPGGKPKSDSWFDFGTCTPYYD